jgi:hypothetical protein
MSKMVLRDQSKAHHQQGNDDENQRTYKLTKLVEATWEQALRKTTELPVNWMQCSEVLVGRTA